MSIVRDVMRAVHGSSLPAPGRHLVLTLCSLADEDTGIVPEADSPSMSDLAEMTGLGRSTVARMLNLVEECKWIERHTPPAADAWSRKVSNWYTVAVGTSPAAGLVDDGHDTEPTSPGEGLVPERDQSETVDVRTSTSPAAGHASIRTKDSLSKPLTSEHSSRGSPRPEKPPRPDVERLCAHLAEWIVKNGSKPPTVSQRWRDECRRMIDIDGRTETQVKAAIDWCQQDPFWRANILSMPKLREQYDRLRLAAVAKTTRTDVRAPPPAAPAAVPAAEQCPEHPGRRASTCGLCRANRHGRPPDQRKAAS